ncbi:MAG: sulfatase-like hydrolase/transferase [Bacilli bacterium]|nr:sulfatase-like hydrolase/transferase [Bacilli bacterium]
MKEKKLPLFIYSFITILFVEFIFRALTIEKFFSMSLVYVLFNSIIVAYLINFISKFFNEKTNKIIFFIITFILFFWISAEIVYKNIFNVYFSISLLKLADQLMTFWKDTLGMIGKNILYILVVFLPFIGTFFISKKIDFKKSSLKVQGIRFAILLILILGFKGILLINKKDTYSAYNLYYNVNDVALSMEKFGVLNASYLDVKKAIIGFEEEIKFVDYKNEEEEQEIVYSLNIDEKVNFDNLIQNEKNATIKSMHEYFNNDSGTYQNEYTGYFKDKNLILFMAESYNMIAVNEELTPTLYKLTNSGFKFNNFYTPVNNSTIGGEFQELTGLYANGSILKTWRNGKNSFPYGIANMFENIGYTTYAYHNHYYTFQDRNKYLKSLGFDNFMGCYNGLEKKINCKSWPESDVQMIEATVNDYINDDNFMVFYASVSGHGGYSWSGNNMSKKHKEEVKNLPYSEPVKAYIAAQMEFDKALELLIEKLKVADKLDDTVIAFVGDHYPYMLSLSEINEISTYKRDNVIEINRSNFVLWNSEMDTIEIDKVGSQIDVIPTLYNVFGLNYDSRLFIGKDILSTEPGLAIMNNRSWVSDKGKYFANSKEFIPNEGIEVDDDYVNTMNSIVSSKITMSKNIIEHNYYKKVLGD